MVAGWLDGEADAKAGAEEGDGKMEVEGPRRVVEERESWMRSAAAVMGSASLSSSLKM